MRRTIGGKFHTFLSAVLLERDRLATVVAATAAAAMVQKNGPGVCIALSKILGQTCGGKSAKLDRKKDHLCSGVGNKNIPALS